MARIGVFVCHCGTNIAKTVDVDRVAAAAARMPNVAYATTYLYMCSDPGQNIIKEAVKEHSLDRIVVAACSPSLHEKTFQKCAEAAGLNPYFSEMANIREQCSWVHSDREEATAKAIKLVQMAVARAYYDQELYQSQIPVHRRALVIGGGVAGIQAALDVAASGYEVVLVERTPSIGGRMAQFDKTFPTLDCAACILTPKMVEVASDPNVKIVTYAEVESVSGFLGNFEAVIRRRARSVRMDACNGCGVCYQKCPSKKIPSEFNAGLGTRTAIYVPFPQAVPNVPVIDRENCRYFLTGKCRICEKVCSAQAIDFDQQDEILKEQFGAIIVATGIDVLDHSIYGEYGYGRYPDVISGLQLERLINAGGPTQGILKRPSDGKEPESVVFIQCVGSRDDSKGFPYCSKVCCMYTAKHTILLKEKHPETEIYSFYIDIRSTGKGYEEFVRRAQEEFGVHYLRGRVSRVYPRGDKMVVMGVDSLLGQQVEVEADLVVLATAAQARSDAKELARKLNVATDRYNFFTEAHPKLRPVETLTAGVFLAGACQFPKDIPDSVASGSAAAAKVASMFSKPFLLSEPTVAEVLPLTCVGCLNCQSVCPFNAIDEVAFVNPLTREEKKVAKVNEGLCNGCGTCVAACYSSSIQLRGFTDEQIFRQIETALAP